ncbi:MAG: guanylate kinase [Gammaproteobacteria bacterium]|nr:guanylate kinase [Gammaproteobacteria bacterium]
MTVNSLKSGTLFIISAPSGAGKTTLVQALLETLPNLYVSVSHTTRDKRPYEKNSIDYHFVDPEQFELMAESGQFLEHARVFDNRYGTSRQIVEEQLQAGRNIILEIEWQGARQVRDLVSNVVSIFIFPPSYDALESRLGNRGDGDEVIQRRMQDAKADISHYGEYDYLVINDDFQTALQELITIISASRHNYRQHEAFFDDFVRELLVEN